MSNADDPLLGSSRDNWDHDLSAGEVLYAARPPVAHKLESYEPIIDVRLEEFPALSAQRLFDEVRAEGYVGGYNRVRDYVGPVRGAGGGAGAFSGRRRDARVRWTPARSAFPWGRRDALAALTVGTWAAVLGSD